MTPPFRTSTFLAPLLKRVVRECVGVAGSKPSPTLHTLSQPHSCAFNLSPSLHSTATALYSTTTLGSLYEGLKPPHGFLGWLIGKYRQTVSVLAQATHQKRAYRSTPHSHHLQISWTSSIIALQILTLTSSLLYRPKAKGSIFLRI